MATAEADSTLPIIRFLDWSYRGTLFALAAILAIWVVYPMAISLVLAGLVVVDAALIRSASRRARIGDHEAAAIRFAISAWLTSGFLGVVAPALYPLVLLTIFLPLAPLISYGSRRLQIRSFLVCGLVAALASAATFAPPLIALDDAVPPALIQTVNVVFVSIVAALFCLALWDSIERTRGAHRALLDANAALSDSEAQLERKVAERTAELERSQLQLSSARDEAITANAAKSRFLAAASHDLRQPIHALRLFAEALASARDPGRMQDLARRITDSADSLTAMLDELLDLSRLESGNLEVTLAEFPLDPLIEQLVSELESDARKKGLLLAYVPTQAVVRSDPLLLRRILQNLLVNALRHTDAGRVLVGCRRAGPNVRIEVWDTGPGIPSELLGEIFREFTQLDQKRRSEGLGLGLAIVERLARLLGSQIEVESRVGRGSVFKLALPRARPLPEELGAVQSDVTIPGLAGARIVVIDDDLQILDGMRVLLEGWGCRIRVARSGDEAASAIDLAEPLPEILIADYSLAAGETGIAAIERVRQRCAQPIPALVITGETDPSIRAEVQAAGLLQLMKPIPPARLRAALAALHTR